MAERVAAVRKSIGPEVDLCVNLHARYDVPSACRIAWEMEPFNLLWLESRSPRRTSMRCVKVRARSRTPICVGENLYLRWGFRDLLEQQAADVVMPDVPKCGGLAESKKIANLAEIYYIPFAPHLVSTPLGTMATCHTCAAVPNFLVLEWHALEERDVWDSYVLAPDGSGSIVKDGHITLPDAPGIGVDLNMENVRRNAAPGFGVFEYPPNERSRTLFVSFALFAAGTDNKQAEAINAERRQTIHQLQARSVPESSRASAKVRAGTAASRSQLHPDLPEHHSRGRERPSPQRPNQTGRRD
jgi:hypothetical protein